MRNLTITLLQAELDWQAPESNRARFEQLIAASSEVSDLIILPEMFTTGFTMEARKNAETMDGNTVAWMAKVAGNEQVTLCGSIIIDRNGRNSRLLALITNREFVAVKECREFFPVSIQRIQIDGYGRRAGTILTVGNQVTEIVCDHTVAGIRDSVAVLADPIDACDVTLVFNCSCR